MKEKQLNVRTVSFVGMLGAISTVLMMFRFTIPFAPTFLKFDISELPALFAGFFMGPLSGCAVVVIKNLLKLVVQGTDTAFVGDLMNIFGSICFVLPAALIYKVKHTRRGALTAMISSSVFISVMMIFVNWFVAFPMYIRLYGMPMEAIIEMGATVNPLVKDMFTLMVFGVLPFNLLKHGITSLVTYVVYKRTGKALRSVLMPVNVLSEGV